MKMMICFLFAFSSLSVLAKNRNVDQSSMVFMREFEKEKQIMMADGDGGNVTALTKGKLWHLYPAINPAGTEVSFVAGSDQSSLHLMTLNLQKNILEQWTLPAKKGLNLHPAYSGNGQWITFTTPVGENKINQIAYFNADQVRRTTSPQVITSEEGPIESYDVKFNYIPSEFPSYFPAFSSDNSFIVFERSKPDKTKDIMLFDIASAKLSSLTDPNGVSMSPSLSFDDRYVAYTAKVEGNWDVYIKDRLAGKTYRATNHANNDYAPTFNSNNDLVFASDRSGHFQLYKMSYVSWLAGVKDEALMINSLEADDYAPSFSGNKYFTQSTLENFSAPARSSFGAITHNDRVYMVGGHQGPEHTYPESSFMNAVEYYDLKNKTWNKTAPRSVAAHGFALATFGKYIYAFGGFTYEAANKPAWKSIDIIERLDTETQTWEVMGKMPRNRSSNVVVTIGTKAYIIGGWDSTPKTPGDLEGTFHRDIDIFDFETNKVTVAPFKLPDPLRRAFSAVNYNNKIILVGGLGVGSSHFELLNNVTELDPENGTSRELKAMPFATFAPAAGVLGKDLFVFGGMFKLGEMEYNYVPHIYSLDLPDNKWTHTGRYLTEAKGFSQVVNISEKTLGILGGHSYQNDTDSPVSTFELFTKAQSKK